MNVTAVAFDHRLVGDSPQIGVVRRLIEKAARNRLPVLLLGESGSGKEVVARGIYNANPCGQFVPIDCGSLVGSLMESELFGHTKGSFSGAVENKKGLVPQIVLAPPSADAKVTGKASVRLLPDSPGCTVTPSRNRQIPKLIHTCPLKTRREYSWALAVSPL